MSEYLFELKGVNGQLYVNDDHIVIERKGALSLLSQGLKGKKEIPISNITAIQVKPATGWTNGYIQFSILGGVECGGGLFAATEDENAVVFAKKGNDIAEEIKAFMQERIRPTETNSGATNQLSAADEIVKFKQLLDSGIITEDEFNAKKEQLLGI